MFMRHYRNRGYQATANILAILARLEKRFDDHLVDSNISSVTAPLKGPISMFPTSYSTANAGVPSEIPNHSSSAKLHQALKHLTASRKAIMWPRINDCITASGAQPALNLQYLLREEIPWFVRQGTNMNQSSMPTNPGLTSLQVNKAPSDEDHGKRCVFPSLTAERIQEYSHAYFNSFNIIHPLLDYDTFMNQLVANLLREGYSYDDPRTVIALTVFALGQLALEGMLGEPISSQHGVPSGLRGGDPERPPGLEMFNEARRRLGNVVNTCTLENAQMMLLLATYYETNSMYMDAWSSVAKASTALQILVQCQKTDGQLQSGDMIKRVYWICFLVEENYHIHLGLPRTGIHLLEHKVPLPRFYEHEGFQRDSRGSKGRSHDKHYFLAMIALWRLYSKIHAIIVHEC